MSACGIWCEVVAVVFPTLGHFTPLPGIIARIEGPSMGNFVVGGQSTQGQPLERPALLVNGRYLARSPAITRSTRNGPDAVIRTAEGDAKQMATFALVHGAWHGG
jgi:hypothetical protein